MNRCVFALPPVLLLALAACGPEPVEVRPAGSPPIASQPPRGSPTGATGELAFVDPGGVERLRLACRAGGRLQITVPGFEPVGSEDRLTLGVGDEAFAHVADLAAAGPGVTGGGPVDVDLIDRLERGEPVRAVYGAQSAGPLKAAGPKALAAFVEGCRGP